MCAASPRPVVPAAALLLLLACGRAEESISQHEGVLTLQATNDICFRAENDTGVASAFPPTCVSQVVAELSELAVLLSGQEALRGRVSVLAAGLGTTNDQITRLSSSQDATEKSVSSLSKRLQDAPAKIERVSVSVAQLRRDLVQGTAAAASTNAAAFNKLRAEVGRLQASMVQVTSCTAQGLLVDPESLQCYAHPCQTSENKCPADSACVATGSKSLKCVCNTGFVPTGDDGCRPTELCGREQKVACGTNKACLAVPDSSTNTCICKKGTVQDASGACKTWSSGQDMSFWRALQSYEVGQYIREGSGAGKYFPDSFWTDECASGGNYIVHSIDCGTSPTAGGWGMEKKCRYRHDDTSADRNWIQFHTKFPVMIENWRIKGRNHSPIYLGRIDLQVLRQNGGWTTLSSPGRTEPGRCAWSARWGLAAHSGTVFRFRMYDAARTAYQAFSRLDFRLASMTAPQIKYPDFQSAIKEVTYSKSFIDGTKSGVLKRDGSNIFSNECTPGGAYAVHSIDKSYLLGQNWIIFEMKAGIKLYAASFRGRRHPLRQYLGSWRISGSFDGKEWHTLRVQDNYDPGECLMGPTLGLSDTASYTWYKIDVYNGIARGYQAFSNAVLHANPVTY